MSETIKDVVSAYRQGEMTLDQLAENIAGRTWPPIPHRTVEQTMAEEEDDDPFAPGTWNGDVLALTFGDEPALTREEYRAISAAADGGASRPPSDLPA